MKYEMYATVHVDRASLNDEDLKSSTLGRPVRRQLLTPRVPLLIGSSRKKDSPELSQLGGKSERESWNHWGGTAADSAQWRKGPGTAEMAGNGRLGREGKGEESYPD